jgi:hypothetical protein
LNDCSRHLCWSITVSKLCGTCFGRPLRQTAALAGSSQGLQAERLFIPRWKRRLRLSYTRRRRAAGRGGACF